MKIVLCFMILLVTLVLNNCQNIKVPVKILTEIEAAFQQGDFTKCTQWGDSLLALNQTDSITKEKVDSLIDQCSRIRYDFSLSERDVEAQLNEKFKNISPSEKRIWEQNNWLEYKIIDDEKWYFKRTLSNLQLIINSKAQENKSVTGLITDSLELFRLKHTQKVIALSSAGIPVSPTPMTITYQIIVKADAVPEGEIIRCWMPYPQETNPRQGEVNLINTQPGTHFIAPETQEQRSLYMEQKAKKGEPTLFEMQLSYQSSAQYFDLSKIKPQPYDTSSPIFKKYTAEQYPQIQFSKQITELADSIVKGASSPAEIVKKLYYWINDHIIWTGALEYSIIPQIPEYVLKYKRGDCGMQTLLFISMARSQGIPVKWQSGWMMHPGEVNLHDWSEVYYQGIGWVPLDMSFNLQNSQNIHEKEFYISGIDAYRLIINDAIGSPFNPEKRFLRSEPYDFQRGEVEWRGGNLYFDQWKYHLKVSY